MLVLQPPAPHWTSPDRGLKNRWSRPASRQVDNLPRDWGQYKHRHLGGWILENILQRAGSQTLFHISPIRDSKRNTDRQTELQVIHGRRLSGEKWIVTYSN